MQLTMHCQHCKAFLADFLQADLDLDIPLRKQVRIKCIAAILPELVDWMLRTCQRVQHAKYMEAWQKANQIARRGRPEKEYRLLLYSATYNFLKFSESWFRGETEYIKPFLLEAGLLKRTREPNMILDMYIGYVLTRSMIALYELHKDHVAPKGLMTSIEIPLVPTFHKQQDEQTCADKDDYQKEILEEVSLTFEDEDDLYT